MENILHQGKIRTMLDMKVRVGQVLTAIFLAVSTAISVVVYVHSTFETKEDAQRFERRLDKVEESFHDQTKIQTEIAVNVATVKTQIEFLVDEKRKSK